MIYGEFLEISDLSKNYYRSYFVLLGIFITTIRYIKVIVNKLLISHQELLELN